MKLLSSEARKVTAFCDLVRLSQAAHRDRRDDGALELLTARLVRRDLMEAAGFTHGGFYNHFPSKEALAAEACGSAFEQAVTGLAGAVGTESAHANNTFSKYLRQYLSPAHRDDPTGGCPTASFAVDAARQGDQIQAAYAAGIESVLAAFASELSKPAPGKKKKADPAAARARAIRLLSEMVGALVLARAVADANPSLSNEILDASREPIAT